MLVNKNILKKRDLTYKVFTNFITSDFLSDPSLPSKMLPSDYVVECWSRYKKNASPKTYKQSNSLNGKVFEIIIATAMYRCGIKPFYLQATAKLVPDVDYDIILYDKKHEKPITISVKTSARERYKQAALEAYAFRSAHIKSSNYLVLLDPKECAKVQKKIRDGLILGLDKAIQADTEDFDLLISELETLELGTAPSITLFEGQEIL